MTKPGYIYAYQPNNQYGGYWLPDCHDNRVALRNQGYLYSLSPWWIDTSTVPTDRVITIPQVKQAQGGY